MLWVIIILIVWIFYIYLWHPDYDIYSYEHIKNKVKTGDLILFHALDNINPIYIGSYYGHIGMVYVDPDKPETPYLFEAFNTSGMPFYPSKFSNGIALTDLQQRLDTYRGYCFYKELAKPIDKKLIINFKDFIKYAIKNMWYNENVVDNFIKKIFFNERLKKGTNCGEIVYMSLIKLGLISQEHIYNNRFHHLLWLSNVKEVKNNIYLEPVYVLANYFKTN